MEATSYLLFNLPIWLLQELDKSWRMNVDDSKLNQISVLTLTVLSDVVILLEQFHKVCDNMICCHRFDEWIFFCFGQKRGSEIVCIHMKMVMFICIFTHGSVSLLGFPGGSVVKNLPATAGDTGSIPESGRSAGAGNGNPLQYSCLGNSMDRGVWKATVHGVTKE